MRLYLSSFRVGGAGDRLVAMVGAGGRAVVIANAMDAEPPEARRAGVAREREALTDLGFEVDELDLRDWFGADGVEQAFAGYDVAWLRGGNVFVLRHALARSGADRALIGRLEDDTIAYAGYSAGPCVLAPSLRGLEAVDPVDELRAAYGAEPTWEGLAVLDHAVVPHVDSPAHPASAALDRVAEGYRRDGIAHVALRDGQVLVVEGEAEDVMG